jgi:hypothetical protein
VTSQEEALLVADFTVHREASSWLFSRRELYFKYLDERIQRRVFPQSDGGTGALVRVAWPHALKFYEVGDFGVAAAKALDEHARLCAESERSWERVIERATKS